MADTRVLMSRPAWPTTGNTMNAELSRALAGVGWTVVEFSWSRALRLRYDVWLDNWPETLVQRWSPRLPAVGRQGARWLLVLTGAALARCGSRRVVLIVHNDRPHERLGRLERAVLNTWTRAVVGWVHLSPETAAAHAQDPRHVRIRHGTYPVPDEQVRARPAPGPAVRLLAPGHVRPYKDLPRLAREVTALAGEVELLLRVAGTPADADEVTALQSLAPVGGRVELRLAWLSEDEMVEEMRSADAVVLAHRRLTNSGVALHALSAGVAVVGPRTSVLQELQDEVGPAWVHLYQPPVDAVALRDAHSWVLATREERRGQAPDLRRYRWADQALVLEGWLSSLSGTKAPRAVPRG